MHQRDVDQVLAQEPHLQFVGSQNVADDQIVGAVIPNFGSTARQLPAVTNNHLMRIQ